MSQTECTMETKEDIIEAMGNTIGTMVDAVGRNAKGKCNGES